jgi:IS4 transposase
VGLVFTDRNFYTLHTKAPERVHFEKDVVYRFLGDSRIHWEQILSHTAYVVITEINKDESVDKLAVNVIDDTPYYRDRSKKVEMLSRFYDHSQDQYYKGFVLLCLGWTDGETFLPVKSQMVASGEGKKLLVDSKVKVDHRTLATRRRVDARKAKTTLTYQMLESIKGTPAQTKYVLFDSWFQSPISLLTVKNIGYDVVTKAKNNENYRYLHNGEMKSISKIYKASKKRRGKSRYLLSVEVQVEHEDFDEPIPVKIVFVRDKNNKKKWVALMSTDVTLSEDQIVALYELRWKIEPFFKVLKSYLKLEKEFQTRSFDAITAHASIVMIRYIILSLRNRENNTPTSVCDVFFMLCSELEDLTFKSLFTKIVDSIKMTLNDYLCLHIDTINGFLAHFMSIIPDFIKAKLGKSVCES